MQRILIIAEDHRFSDHFGFDIIAITRAILKRIFFSKIEGASTIEQQLVRVLINNYKKTLKRKINEIFLATLVQDVIPRHKIPELYLKVAYYGWEMNGINEAYRKLGVNALNLSYEQSIDLVARIKYPEPKFYSKQRQVKINNRKIYLKKRDNLFQKRDLNPLSSLKNTPNVSNAPF